MTARCSVNVDGQPCPAALAYLLRARPCPVCPTSWLSRCRGTHWSCAAHVTDVRAGAWRITTATDQHQVMRTRVTTDLTGHLADGWTTADALLLAIEPHVVAFRRQQEAALDSFTTAIAHAVTDGVKLR